MLDGLAAMQAERVDSGAFGTIALGAKGQAIGIDQTVTAVATREIAFTVTADAATLVFDGNLEGGTITAEAQVDALSAGMAVSQAIFPGLAAPRFDGDVALAAARNRVQAMLASPKIAGG